MKKIIAVVLSLFVGLWALDCTIYNHLKKTPKKEWLLSDWVMAATMPWRWKGFME